VSECGGPGTSGKEDEEEDKELARRYPESGFPRIRVAPFRHFYELGGLRFTGSAHIRFECRDTVHDDFSMHKL
jgi:hypothetical protein